MAKKKKDKNGSTLGDIRHEDFTDDKVANALGETNVKKKFLLEFYGWSQTEYNDAAAIIWKIFETECRKADLDPFTNVASVIRSKEWTKAREDTETSIKNGSNSEEYRRLFVERADREEYSWFKSYRLSESGLNTKCALQRVLLTVKAEKARKVRVGNEVKDEVDTPSKQRIIPAKRRPLSPEGLATPPRKHKTARISHEDIKMEPPPSLPPSYAPVRLVDGLEQMILYFFEVTATYDEAGERDGSVLARHKTIAVRDLVRVQEDPDERGPVLATQYLWILLGDHIKGVPIYHVPHDSPAANPVVIDDAVDLLGYVRHAYSALVPGRFEIFFFIAREKALVQGLPRSIRDDPSAYRGFRAIRNRSQEVDDMDES